MLDKRLSTSVIHIHGIYDSVRGVDNIIADNQQYANIIDNQGAQFIQGVLGTRTLVFVGCGKTTEDANISRFIQFANRHLKMDQQYFFLQNSKKPVEGLPTNILPVSYGDDYDDLALFHSTSPMRNCWNTCCKENRNAGWQQWMEIIQYAIHSCVS